MEEKIRLKQYVSLRSKGRHNYNEANSPGFKAGSKKVAGLEWLIYIQGILFARKTANLNFVNLTTITLP